MTTWQIRKATEADHDFLVDCGTKIAFETEGKVLEKEVVEKGVLNCL